MKKKIIDQEIRLQEIQQHIFKYGSGVESIDHYAQEQLKRNNKNWALIVGWILLISIGICIATHQ